jgi:hypothetical protein
MLELHLQWQLKNACLDQHLPAPRSARQLPIAIVEAKGVIKDDYASNYK